MATRHFEVTLKRSAAGWPEDQQKTLRSLGLKKMGRTIFLKDTPAVRGQLFKLVHVLAVMPHDGEPLLLKRGLRRKQGPKKAAKTTKKQESRA